MMKTICLVNLFSSLQEAILFLLPVESDPPRVFGTLSLGDHTSVDVCVGFFELTEVMNHTDTAVIRFPDA